MSRASEQTIVAAADRSSAPVLRTPGEAPATPRFDGGPALLVDLMIASVLAPSGGLVSLDPDGEQAALSLRRGNATIARMSVPADVAAAAIGRLGKATGLDPLVERGSLTESQAARLTVRLGARGAAVLVTMGATTLGMAVELRVLAIDGQAVDRSPRPQLKRCTVCGTYQPSVRERCDLDGAALREVWDDPKPGGTIGVYRLLSLLGEGAVGQVFAGEHALLERKVAIKVLRAPLVADPALESRFLFEARAASRLRHPNLVEVSDYGVLASGSPFIVMERLDGEPLERSVSQGRALHPEAALRIARAVALGLSAAHDGGVIHNDLKPSNVILARELTAESPRVKVIDFGAASLAGVEDDGILVGTAAYMAPERVCGEMSDARSDGYSLGVMLYVMLNGEHPFDADDHSAMFMAHVNRIPDPVTSPYGALPRSVVRLVMRALEKKPSERYQSMKQMIVDIDRALESLAAPAWRKWLP